MVNAVLMARFSIFLSFKVSISSWFSLLYEQVFDRQGVGCRASCGKSNRCSIPAKVGWVNGRDDGGAFRNSTRRVHESQESAQSLDKGDRIV